jgi:hypothetical protein
MIAELAREESRTKKQQRKNKGGIFSA